ncbi:MAG: flagellar biosynthesis anti-sigma factor FlgM [Oscillospiraceae bacterium]|nr:flagellar biosynthesis anti-sigma factor FlgM [Oscillospiraceae bacterium]
MTMKLSGFNGVAPRGSGPVAPSVENNPKNNRPGLARAEKRDTVFISQEGSQQSEAARMAKTLAGEIAGADNSEKVARLRASVGNGTYQVASSEVAKAILDGVFA